MKARTGLGLSAAALAWLCFSPDASATGQPQPGVNLTYSAETVALSSGGNTAPIQTLDYTTKTGTTLAAGNAVTWSAPTGNNWAIQGGTTCRSNPGAVLGVLTGGGTNNLTCTLGAGGPYTNVHVSNPSATPTVAVTLSGPNVALLGTNIEVGQQGGGGGGVNPSAEVQINAQGTGDTAPIPNVGLTSRNTFALTTAPVPLGIDLTGTGLPAIPPGAGFTTRSATGANSVSTAGFLGTFWINYLIRNIDARIISNAAGVFNLEPRNGGSLTGTATVALTGDFATITSAYLIPNNTGAPNGNQSACAPTAPGNSIAGAISAGKNTITFSNLTSPAVETGNANQPVFAVCLVTNGTQVIQASNAPQSNGVAAIAINASINVTGITNAIGLTAPNQGFGEINYLGTAFFVQNVLGFNNGAETFFRIVNQGNTAAPIWAVLTKDVPNTTPEVGAGSCNYAVGQSSATLAAQPVPPNAVNPPTTCNVSFVAGLRSIPGLTIDAIATNSTGGGPNGGFVTANNATYITGDDIAVLAGTSLNPVANQGSLHATVWLLSPNAGVRFSALAQATALGVIIPTQ